MTIQRFKLALNNARTPLVSTKASRAVFIPGLDSAPRTPRTFMGADDSVDYNMSQIIYSENVMPVAEGIHSVRYTQTVAPTVNRDFDSIFALRDEDENTVLYSPAGGKNYVYDQTAGAWSSTPYADIWPDNVLAAGLDPANSKVTYAYVDGYTFVCFSRLKSDAVVPVDMSIMVWNSATKELEPATSLITNLILDAGGIVGVNGWFGAGTLDGIASSNGYLIVWSGITIAWGRLTDVDNDGTSTFEFSVYANGAAIGGGQAIPEDIQGNINAIIGVPGGFIAFTNRNAISATYHSQSLSAPWVMREIPNAGGLESYEQATVEGSLGSIIAYTTAGLQTISLNSADSKFPAVSDFIAGREIERYRYDLQELYQGQVTLDFYVKLTAVANRYIVVSYGTFPKVYSFALVYDLALERWGKLRKVHRDCFYYSYGKETASLTYAALGDIPYDHPELTTYEGTTGQSNELTAAQHGLAFLLETGEVRIANWSNQPTDDVAAAVAIIGRIQLTRSSNVQLNRLEIEGLQSGTAYIQPSYDGRNLQPAQSLVEIESTEDYKLLGTMIDCKNFNLVVHGNFELSTIIIEATTSGKM